VKAFEYICSDAFEGLPMRYFQCRLRQGNKETIGWIEERGAKEGRSRRAHWAWRLVARCRCVEARHGRGCVARQAKTGSR